MSQEEIEAYKLAKEVITSEKASIIKLARELCLADRTSGRFGSKHSLYLGKAKEIVQAEQEFLNE